MAARLSTLSETVKTCVARHDGGYLVVTRRGNSGSSPVEIPEGVSVVIRDGKAVRAVR